MKPAANISQTLRASRPKIISLVVACFALTYPFLIYIGRNEVSASVFAWLILILSVLRFIVMRGAHLRAQRYLFMVTFIVILLFCASVIVFNQSGLLYYYPALMSATVSLLFFSSLAGKQSLIEQLMVAVGKPPPTHAIGYLRGLSLCWGLFLMINASISAAAACCSTPYFWMLYNGLISYAAMAIFIGVEWLYRLHYKRVRGLTNA